MFRNTCPVTGESACKCDNRYTHLKTNNDIKCVMRKLFTDHALYTRLVLMSIMYSLPDLSIMLNRLLTNQSEIGHQISIYLSEKYGLNSTSSAIEYGSKLSELLKQHIHLAGNVITMAVKKQPVDTAINQLFANSDQVANALTHLNPSLLPFDTTSKMFRMHNQYVIDMTLARLNNDFAKDQKLLDAYYNEMLEMSDSITKTLI